MTRLNEIFREVTNGLICRATGKLSLDLRSGLVPNPDNSSGEAFGSAGQVVGFDLTCLSAAINGNASHPRLLVHDSPREADLNELIYRNLFRYVLSLEARFPDLDEVDPILWTKKGHSLATLLPAFLTGNTGLILHPGHACGIASSPGETEVGSAGEHPAKG